MQSDDRSPAPYEVSAQCRAFGGHLSSGELQRGLLTALDEGCHPKIVVWGM